MFHVAYGIIRPPVEKSRKVNFFQFLTFIVFVGDHEFWQDGSVHAFQSLLIAFVSDLLPRQVRAINEFQSLFGIYLKIVG